ncbi:DUF3152 domain-containing protein [Kitasatospora sp. CM 4170]|uniref:DUF3152 domain-containing protein n=1 Tax=Kitasatospora aburaviensis TaxID=67265 RepID=A0ABW1FCD3_9ACTN|nr:DUF3152 domain-containing protein [Kitasatospora sp. CM 4170]WNM48038.1 DUF3152 domain-containing protein [Kitasatospora sp. CM 4170]
MKGALALLLVAAVAAGLLWWHPWSGKTAGPKPLQFTSATGGSDRFGTGAHLYRYKVRVEDGLAERPEQFAAEVDAVLGNVKLGWAAGGEVSFQRVAADPVDFTVYLATPKSTDRICGQYGLDTGGWVNCGAGHQVVINVKRWTELSEFYVGRPELYHALAVNHEVGHILGNGHVDCPGPGAPAPVMQQQIKGLNGCVPNGWPYSDTGALLTGPPTPDAIPSQGATPAQGATPGQGSTPAQGATPGRATGAAMP